MIKTTENGGISSKALAFGEPKNKENTFQGQRFDDDLGLNGLQFKWRNHDPQIGRFIEIDPLAAKYEYNSTYAFSENKVTGHIELEGLEAVVSNIDNSKRKEGAIKVEVTGKLINESSVKISPEKMQEYADRINKSSSTYFSFIEGKFESVGNFKISVETAESPLAANEIAYRIVDPVKIPDPENPGKFVPNAPGASENGGSAIYLSSGILERTPDTNGKWQNTGKSKEGRATLERTAGHEAGHILGLYHPNPPESEPGTLMTQTFRREAGVIVTKEQVQQSKQSYDNGKLNSGKQKF